MPLIFAKQFQRYYVSPDGNDSNSGTSEAFAWKTTAKVVAADLAGVFRPGDQILFESGRTFAGSQSDVDGAGWLAGILITVGGGNATWPLVFGAYGEGDRPIIETIENENGIFIEGVEGVRVTDLIFAGPGTGAATENFNFGVIFDASTATAPRRGFLVENVEAYGHVGGITAGCFYGTAYIDGLTIRDCDTHDNMIYGARTFGPDAGFDFFRVRNLLIDNVRSYENPGTSETQPAYGTSPGISIQATQGGVVKNCVTYRNGRRGAGGIASVGVETIVSDQITLQDCESYSNYTTSDTNNDGDGFDFDSGTTNSVMERCFSHDNDGIGLYAYSPAVVERAHSGNVIRYCTSMHDNQAGVNDGGSLAIVAPAALSGINVHNVTLISNQASRDVVRLSGSITSSRIANSIIKGDDAGQNLVNAVGNPGVDLRGNDYHGSMKFRWNGVDYASFAAFQTATNQEKISGSNVGITSDPLVVNVLTDPHLQAGSPMIDAGLNLSVQFGVNPGTQDAYGNTIPQGSGYDVGSHEKA